MKGKANKQMDLYDSIEEIEKETIFLKSIKTEKAMTNKKCLVKKTKSNSYGLKELSIRLRQEPDFINQLRK